MNDRELMQMALEALESVFEGDDKGAEYWTVNGGTYEAVECMNAMRALRAALAQPEQEPVAWMHTTATGDIYFRKKPHDKVFSPQPVYTAPPQREWQGLTDEERREIFESMPGGLEGFCRTWGWLPFTKAIEAKLKEKNGA